MAIAGKARKITIRVGDCLAEIWNDEDGWWAHLGPGWHDQANPGAHVMVADSEVLLVRAIEEDAEPCDCDRCWPKRLRVC